MDWDRPHLTSVHITESTVGEVQRRQRQKKNKPPHTLAEGCTPLMTASRIATASHTMNQITMKMHGGLLEGRGGPACACFMLSQPIRGCAQHGATQHYIRASKT